jgi:Ribbon-helix-helix domain
MKSLILPVNALSPLWVPVTDRERPGGETTQSKGRSPDWVKVQNPHRTCCNEVDRGMKFDRRCELPIKSLVVKQSVIVNGRDSSVSLEGAFWKALKKIAVGQNISVPLSFRKSTMSARPPTCRRPSACMLSNTIVSPRTRVPTNPRTPERHAP